MLASKTGNATEKLNEGQRVTGIPVPGNSRENQVRFFPLALEKLFSISRLLLET